MSIYLKLMNIQTALKAPKSQYNSFGKYSYRNCEDILEALKPLLLEEKAIVNITDEIILIGERYYVKATARIIDAENGEFVEVSALAREDATKKGMDSSQLTGSTSSYARKYALNGLFAIDDTKDSDTTNTHDKTDNTSNKKLSDAQIKRLYTVASLAKFDNNKVNQMVLQKYKKSVEELSKEEYDNVVNGFQSIIDTNK